MKGTRFFRNLNRQKRDGKTTAPQLAKGQLEVLYNKVHFLSADYHNHLLIMIVQSSQAKHNNKSLKPM